jgi:glycosyltransferase involved in cell wall biosynthesis
MVVHAYYPLAETRVQRQAEALVAHGYEVDVICLRLPQESAFEVVQGVKVYRLPVKRKIGQGFSGQIIEYLYFLALAALKLVRLFHRQGYGVVQVHNLPDFLVFCAVWPKLVGAKVILDIHDVMPEFMAARTGYTLNHWSVRLVVWQEKLACRFANHVITVTELWRQALIERGTPAHKISVVMNVADDRLFHRGVKEDYDSQAKSEGFQLVYHGTQTYRYGLDILLQAVAQIRTEIPGLHLILHGTGDYHNQLVNLAIQLNLTDLVEFNTSFVPVTELPRLIARADIGLVPYRSNIFTDGILPTKLMEYVALGLPTLAPRTPAITAYFDDTMVQFFETGNADDLAAKILALYRDEIRRQELICQSEQFIQRHNWSTQSAQYAHLVDQLNQF